RIHSVTDRGIRGDRLIVPRRRRGGGGSVEEFAVPQLEDGEREQLARVPARTRVIRQQSLDRRLFEVTSLQRLAIEDDVREPVSKIVSQPGAVRYGEASLPSRQDFLRHAAIQHFLGEIFRGQATHLEVARQRRGKFQQPVVEQRNTQFDRIR